ncbi:GAF and ANTAR domain-containing protein [Streptomyces huasconensis]|uniref:GAF and ANTAR domain-containing protein n=1 Tax=Streptomyces huasconensis TaxID=1854574 RepID=A0ABV3M5N7_9ACTN
MTHGCTVVDLVLHATREAPEELPRRLCRALCQGLPADGASLVFLTETPYRQLLHATDPVTLRLEELQFVADEGPCVSAAVSGKPLLVDDFRRPLTRWPLFEAAMGDELGEIGAVHVLPLTFDDKVFGTVELMRREPVSLEHDATDREMVRQAEAAARVISRVMLPSFWRLLAHGELPLWKPSDQIDTHWGTTHQASDKLAAHLDISPEEALARLRASAFVTGRPLPEIAREINDMPSDGPSWPSR